MPDAAEWSQPGVFEVAPGVHRMPLPLPNDGLRAVNVYLLESADGLVLIDAGWSTPGAREQFDAGLAAIDATAADITRFLVTHVHRDHYSLAVTVRREFGTRVEIGLGERPNFDVLHPSRRHPLGAQLARLASLDAAELAAAITADIGDREADPEEWQPPDAWISPGQIALPGGRVLEAIETPGHTQGHLVFHDPDGRVLFAGDHVLPTITPSIGFEPAPTPAPLADFLSSLARVRERPDAMLLPAHGPVAPSVHRRVDELLDHHERRLAEMAAVVSGGAATVAEVAGTVPWTRRQRSLASLDRFNQMLAVFETGAHLDLLASRGVLTRTEVEGVLRYTVRRAAAAG